MTTGATKPKQPSAADDRLARLMRVLASLAQPREDVGRQSASVVARGEAQIFVVEFDDAYTAYVEGFEQLPSESQMMALQAVDTKLSAMVGAKDAALWTDRALREDQSWTELRAFAADAIKEFGWRDAEAEARVPIR